MQSISSTETQTTSHHQSWAEQLGKHSLITMDKVTRSNTLKHLELPLNLSMISGTTSSGATYSTPTSQKVINSWKNQK